MPLGVFLVLAFFTFFTDFLLSFLTHWLFLPYWCWSSSFLTCLFLVSDIWNSAEGVIVIGHCLFYHCLHTSCFHHASLYTVLDSNSQLSVYSLYVCRIPSVTASPNWRISFSGVHWWLSFKLYFCVFWNSFPLLAQLSQRLWGSYCDRSPSIIIASPVIHLTICSQFLFNAPAIQRMVERAYSVTPVHPSPSEMALAICV